jgi:hypothetical protein
MTGVEDEDGGREAARDRPKKLESSSEVDFKSFTKSFRSFCSLSTLVANPSGAQFRSTFSSRSRAMLLARCCSSRWPLINLSRVAPRSFSHAMIFNACISAVDRK